MLVVICVYTYFYYCQEIVSLKIVLYMRYFPLSLNSFMPLTIKLVVNPSKAASSLKYTWLRVINLVLVFRLITQTDGAFSRMGNRELC